MLPCGRQKLEGLLRLSYSVIWKTRNNHGSGSFGTSATESGWKAAIREGLKEWGRSDILLTCLSSGGLLAMKPQQLGGSALPGVVQAPLPEGHSENGVKLFLFADSIIIFCQIAGYKYQCTKISTFSIYEHQQAEKEIRITSPFIITTPTPTHTHTHTHKDNTHTHTYKDKIGTNLTKEVKDFCNENCKTLKKERN
jgi:hypothetical protein